MSGGSFPRVWGKPELREALEETGSVLRGKIRNDSQRLWWFRYSWQQAGKRDDFPDKLIELIGHDLGRFPAAPPGERPLFNPDDVGVIEDPRRERASGSCEIRKLLARKLRPEVLKTRT